MSLASNVVTTAPSPPPNMPTGQSSLAFWTRATVDAMDSMSATTSGSARSRSSGDQPGCSRRNRAVRSAGSVTFTGCPAA